MLRKLFFIAGIVSFVMAAPAYAQQQGTIGFTGSTPGDELIRLALKIPAEKPSEFIRWNMTLDKAHYTFQLTALYGESQPNTNGFKGGGTEITLNGRYIIETGFTGDLSLKVYKLSSDKLNDPIVLVEMDNRIFHFADSHKKLLVGTGGYSYVLNRVN
jgi:hypothetical protein